MGSQYPEIGEQHRQFIESQKLFFVATAMADGRINLSPKGLDSLRVLGSQQLVWLNLTGSGNETATHLQRDGRITIMFCAFEGPPQILRIYGRARALHPYDEEWQRYLGRFESVDGARQIVLCDVEMVQRSCGFGVPLMTFAGERPNLEEWTRNKGEEGIREYWEARNQRSLDGLPTNILQAE